MEELKRPGFSSQTPGFHGIQHIRGSSGACGSPNTENEGADFEQVGVEMLSQTLLQTIREEASGVTSACVLGFFLCK